MANKLFNAQPHPSATHVETTVAAVSSPVWVSEKPGGPPTPQVKQSTPTTNNLYWLIFSNPDNRTFHSVNFAVTFRSGSPLVNQQQIFSFPGGTGTAIGTPFGVPYWGGDPILGRALLTVVVDGQEAGTYSFSVVA